MRLMIHLGDDGPTDLDLKDGDIFAVKDDAWIPGTLEAKKWLILETENYGQDWSELVKPEYEVGSPDPVQRHARAYYVPYWLKASGPDELTQWRDETLTKAIITGRFNLFDITRK